MKRSDIWMPLHVADYMADTMHLTTQQHGAYMLLLFHYWRKGPITDDDDTLASIAKLTRKAWDRDTRGAVRAFFKRGDDGLLHQKRADHEKAEASGISGERSVAGKKGAESRWGRNRPPDDGGGGGKPMANGIAKRQANHWQDGCQNDAPSPSQKKLLKVGEGGAREAVPCARVVPVVRSIAKALSAKPQPFTPSREYQLSALEIVRERHRPAEPERTVEEQLAQLGVAK